MPLAKFDLLDMIAKYWAAIIPLIIVIVVIVGRWRGIPQQQQRAADQDTAPRGFFGKFFAAVAATASFISVSMNYLGLYVFLVFMGLLIAAIVADALR